MTDTQDSDRKQAIRNRRAAIDTLPPDERPAATADLADLVEAEGLPGVARALRQQALAAARARFGDAAPLVSRLQEAVAKHRITPRPCPLDRPAPPDRASWKARMAALADRRRGRTRP